MRTDRSGVRLFLLAVGLLGCGGSITARGPDGGPDAGMTPTGACASLDACECMAASNRCTPRTEPCWCPSECNPQIACICGGGAFLACEEKTVFAACETELAAVQAKCANGAFVQYIGDICSGSARAPTCVAACLSNLKTGGSCAEIDCYFCPACDCAVPTVPSPFRDCLSACVGLVPEL